MDLIQPSSGILVVASLLLQLLNGLLRPTKGTIQFEDFVLDNHSEPKRNEVPEKKSVWFSISESQLFCGNCSS